MSNIQAGGNTLATPSLIFGPSSGVIPPVTIKLQTDFSSALNLILFG